MAIFHGSRSKYLIEEKLHYSFERLVWAVFFIYLTILIYFFVINHRILFSGNLANQIGAIIAFATAFGPFFFFTEYKIRKESSIYYKFFVGLKGEDTIWGELHNLSDQYHVYQDLHLPGEKTNIDFIVVGPTGVFVIETKNHKGSITFDGSHLMLNGIKFEKNFIHQVENQYWGLHNVLSDKTGFEIFVTPIIVFSNNQAAVNFGLNKINNIIIVQKRWLIKAIELKRQSINDWQKAAILIEMNEMK